MWDAIEMVRLGWIAMILAYRLTSCSTKGRYVVSLITTRSSPAMGVNERLLIVEPT